MSESVLDRIVGRLIGALAYNANAHEAPVALLWPDEAAQWSAVIDRIGERVPYGGVELLLHVRRQTGRCGNTPPRPRIELR